MLIRVKWSFKDTEFEDLQYEEAREILDLPRIIELEDDLDKDEINSELEDLSYGFEIKSWNIDD
tara:strand:- start:681 stop:872 length:192 start_codon:yes stop_codon:yes gene_type:complete